MLRLPYRNDAKIAKISHSSKIDNDNDNDNDLFYQIYTCEVFYILKVGTRFQTVT